MTETKKTSQELKMNIVAQYLKDVSFENKNLLTLMGKETAKPESFLNFDVQSHDLGPSKYEVELLVNARLEVNKKTIYLLEMVYAGALFLECPDPQMVPLILHVECARLLYPSARHLVSTLTQESGLPPLNLVPAIDFMSLYQNKKTKQAAQKN